MRLDENQIVKTSDLGFAATLVTVGYSVSHLEREDPKRVFFCFQRDNKYQSIEDDYWLKNLQVDAYSLSQNIRLLKNRIHGSAI